MFLWPPLLQWRRLSCLKESFEEKPLNDNVTLFKPGMTARTLRYVAGAGRVAVLIRSPLSLQFTIFFGIAASSTAMAVLSHQCMVRPAS